MRLTVKNCVLIIFQLTYQKQSVVSMSVSGSVLSPYEMSFLIFHTRALTLCRATGASETCRCVASPTGSAHTNAHASTLYAVLKAHGVLCPQIARQQQQLLQQQHKINLLQQQIQVRPACVCMAIHMMCTHVCVCALCVLGLCERASMSARVSASPTIAIL